MQRLAALAVTSLLALAACSGGGSTAPRAAGSLAAPNSSYALTAFRVPLTHTAAVDAAFAAGEAKGRKPSGLGGLPTLDGTIDTTLAIIDAPRFGAGAQINVALLGVQAIGADGVAYSIASYPTPVVVNMLNYKTSALVLGHAAIPVQTYSTLRLVVQGSASSMLAWGTPYPVKYGYYDGSRTFTASASDVSTVDFPVKVDLTTGATTILADFNTVESVKIRNGAAMIGSRIGAAPYSSSSVIDGAIVNNAGTAVGGAVIAATDSTGTVLATTMSNDDGTFEIHAIVGGTYRLMVYNDYITAAGDEIVSQGADYTTSVTGPQISVPGGFKVNVGNIKD